MTRWAAVLARLLALPVVVRIAAAVGVGVLALVAGGELLRWYAPATDPVVAILSAPERRRPVELAPSKVARKVERAQVPVAVRPLAPTPKQAERIAETLALNLADGEAVLGVWDAPPAPYGGDVAILSPEAGGDPRAVFVARPAPFLALGGPWEVGGGVMAGTYGYGGTLHLGKDLARVGRLVLTVEADADILADGVEGRVAVLGVVRF